MTSTDAASVAVELRAAAGRLMRRVKAEDEIPIGQVTVLGALDRDGAMTTSELAAGQRVRPQSMARTVSQLLEQGMLRQKPHPTDGRKTLLELSAGGRRSLAEERERRAGWLATAIDGELSQEEFAVLARSVDLLDRLADWKPRG